MKFSLGVVQESLVQLVDKEILVASLADLNIVVLFHYFFHYFIISKTNLSNCIIRFFRSFVSAFFADISSFGQ